MNSPRPLRSTFIPSVNALLDALSLPFSIDDPTDLTPSLLLAIFESLINARLPIPSIVRQSRTRDAKSRAMLILLGVLECDVLRGGTAEDHSLTTSNADDSALAGAGGVSVDGWVDEIGLGEVDPERLADGGWEETIFVGELLCWLARRRGILPRIRSSTRPSHARSLYSNHHSYGTEEGDTADFSTSLLLRASSSPTSRSLRPHSPAASIDDGDASQLSHITDVPRHPLVHSPEPSLSVSATTDLSIRARSVSSHTSVSNTDDSDASQDTVHVYDPRQMMQDADDDDDDRPPTFHPRCIHELEDPSHVRALTGSLPRHSFISHDHVSDGDPSKEGDDDDLYAPATPTPQRVRLTGWIDPVDTTAELGQFAAERAHARAHGFGSSRSELHTHMRRGMSRLNTDVSPPQPSRTPRQPSLSSSPSPPPPSKSGRPSQRIPSHSPSPSSHTAPSDPAFDISFSSLNNTSTPAKPRPVSRPHTTTKRATNNVETAASVGSKHQVHTRRERSPSYTPSPPSFSPPGVSRHELTGISGAYPKPRLGASPLESTRTKQRTSSPAVPLGSTTATTSTLLTERARLLTELAALKRARATSSSGAVGAGGGVRVGIGVRT